MNEETPFVHIAITRDCSSCLRRLYIHNFIDYDPTEKYKNIITRSNTKCPICGSYTANDTLRVVSRMSEKFVQMMKISADASVVVARNDIEYER